MSLARDLPDVPRRQALLHELQPLSPGDPAWTALARLACGRLGCTAAAVCLVDAEYGQVLGAHGMDDAIAAALCRQPRWLAGAHVFERPGADAGSGPPEPGDVCWPGPGWWAGARIDVDDVPAGLLWVSHVAARHLDDEARAALRDLAGLAGALLQARLGEQRLLHHQERMAEAGLAGSDWLWETDAQGTLTWVSDSVLAHTGWTAAQEMGRDSRVLHRPPPAEWLANWDRYRDARERHEPFHDAVAERDTARGTMLVSFSGRPRFDAQGRFCGYRGAARDLTREAAERRVAQRTQVLLQEAIDSVTMAVMISGPDGRILLSNAAWRQRLASLGEDGGAGTWEQLLRAMVRRGLYPSAHGREEEFVRWRMGLVSRSGRQHEMSFDGRHFLVSDQRLSDGSVIHLALDITDRKRAGEQLAEAERRWKYALEGVGDAVWDIDEDVGKVFYSDRWKSMLGHAPEEVGDSFDEWKRRVHPDDKATVFAAIHRHRQGLTPVYTSEYRMRHKEGHWIWVLDRGKIVERRADGSPRRVVGTHTDITRSKLVEQTLREKQAAEMASRAKSEFLSRMSHEMRTPLNAVIGFAQLLATQETVRADYVEQIARAGQHLLALINDVLDLQQVEAGRLRFSLQALEIDALLQGCITLLEPQARRANVAQSLPAAPAPRVLADEQRLRQVLLNIGSNAIKYNRPGGQVRWSVRAEGTDRVCITVEDTGHGMAPEQQARLFQPFERLGRETSSIEGTGLGLLIARRMVQEMQGELAVRSRPGAGTCVDVRLPAANGGGDGPAPPGLAPSAVRTAAAAASMRRVLYVEDNPVNAMLVVEALRGRPQIEVRVVEDGPAALALANTWKPQLLLLDANLPGMNGYEVLALLRDVPGLASVPAVMCSADVMPQDQDRARAAGFVSYWTKPLDIDAMLRDVDRLLPGWD